MANKYIFLDVDGVLNYETTKARIPGEGWLGIEKKKVLLLQSIVHQSHADIILSSSWRYDWFKDMDRCNKVGRYLNKKLAETGLRIRDKTPQFGNGYGRGGEIMSYLEEHPADAWVILDDEIFMGFEDPVISQHFVRTDMKYGLTPERTDRAISVLNGELVSDEEYSACLIGWERDHFGLDLTGDVSDNGSEEGSS